LNSATVTSKENKSKSELYLSEVTQATDFVGDRVGEPKAGLVEFVDSAESIEVLVEEIL
jgi:hypothetical protein